MTNNTLTTAAGINDLLDNTWYLVETTSPTFVKIFVTVDNASTHHNKVNVSRNVSLRTDLYANSYNSLIITNDGSDIISDTTTSGFTNTTMPEAPDFTSANLTKTIVFGVMFLISFIGNLATLIQMSKLRRWKNTINTLIVNLALADLLVTFFCIAGEAAWAATVQWLAGDAMCKFVKYMQVLSLYLSTYITVAISLDRCVAILDPMRRNGAAYRVRIMICFAWIFSALFSIPQLILFNVLRGPFKQEFYQCVNFGSDKSAWQLRLYTIASLMFMFLLPLAVIGTAYGLIFTTISRKSKEHSVMDSFQVSSTKSWVTRWINYKHYLCVSLCKKPASRRASVTSNCSTEQSRGPVRTHILRKAKRKSLRMSFMIVLAFIVCWAPYYILYFYVTFLEKVIDPMLLNCFSFIGLSNTMLNPMIYGAFQLCKVQFYTPSSWRRIAWRGTSPKLQFSNVNRNLRFNFQPGTPASTSTSRDSRNLLVTNNCQCEACHFQVKEQKVCIPRLVQNCTRLDSGRCCKFSQKHFTNGEVNDCLRFHSY